MHIQIEVTTRCNYRCFYCAGRDLPQRHIEMPLFKSILDNLPAGGHRVSLQGEGEPMMHPEFWTMVEMVTAKGHLPYTITNGSLLDVEKVARHFPRIGISLDTVDADEAQRIKRYKLGNVLRRLDELLKVYAPHKIVVHTVDYGQDLGALKFYLEELGISKHIIQPLQVKDDYSYLYPDIAKPVESPIKYSCGFLDAPIMRFYNVDGVVMPCCYIKNVSQFESIDLLKQQLDNKIVPPACAGCRELHEGVEMSRVFLL